MKSYLNKDFLVQSAQARIRTPEDLLKLVVDGNGNPKLIPKGTTVRVTDARVFKEMVFVLTEDWGWTIADNLKNQFINETLAVFEPADNDQKGPNAAWDDGHFLKQITLFQILGAEGRFKFISNDIAEHYLKLVNAAAAADVPMPLKSGFRSYPEQVYLFEGWSARRPGFARAAEPGRSNHQDGLAYDFAIKSYEGNPRYDWLKAHAPAHGFVRTVPGEPWHWEYRPEIAATGAYRTKRVKEVEG
jgi:hypothetical protein